MKIWWPWRKKKQLVSLFEGSIPETREGSSGGAVVLAAEYRIRGRPYRKNAPGPFYVVNQECIACGYPRFVAPNLMAWDETQGTFGATTHCYFAKQPETPEETEQAVKAVAGSCCGALRYAGADQEILRRLG